MGSRIIWPRHFKLFLVIGFFVTVSLKLALDLAPKDLWFGLFTAAYGFSALFAIRVYRRGRRLDPFAPILPAMLLLYLYTASSGLYVDATGMTLYQDTIAPEVLKTYYLACVLGVIGLGLGFNFQGAPEPEPEPSPSQAGPGDRQTLRMLLWLAPLTALVCFPWVRPHLDVINVQPYSETALAGRLAKQAVGDAEPLMEVFLGQVPLVFLLGLSALLLFRTHKLLPRLLGGAIIGLHLMTLVLGGQRGLLAMAGLFLLVYIHYRIRPLGVRSLLVLFALGFLMTSTLSFVRTSADPSVMWQVAKEGFKSGQGSFLAFSKSGEFAVGQNLMRLIAGIRDGQSSFTWGRSIFTELLVFIPRSLLPGRPLPLSEQFVVLFYPGIREIGGGFGFLNLMEGYWAFGLPGVAAFMAAYAWAVQWTYRRFLRSAMTDFKAMWYGFVLYALVYMAVRSGVLGVFKAALINSLPFVIFLLLFRTLRSRGAEGPRPITL